ncbi:histidinol-phosphatase [Limibaculum sp. M0105]|uniref:Histidinol-phosphatase n=1 Tax=Thermohalobaculum xanthum TaxID=2753746 RepID=A0A8J7M9F2_9RHOB|nr:histidinol-phosphatase [Thermohalobaculum xanthum]MBK0401149.1 histidinol-phosphatase [Thermohalobaculum xanthum]
MTAASSLDELSRLARALADAAAQVTLPRFRTADLTTDDKGAAGLFDPVTAADREAEAAIRSILQRERPEDAILGEEHGTTTGRSGLTWVIDPIDGTRAFISGLPVWGTLIALDDGTRGVIGIVDQPFTGERFVGLNTPGASHAVLEHRGAVRAITTRRGRALADSTVFTTAPELFTETERRGFDAVRGAAQLTRYGTDCYAYALLAMGHVDLVIEAGLKAYDIAAPKALIEAAGGIVTGWRGEDCRWGGRVLAAAHPALHAEALELLSGIAPA